MQAGACTYSGWHCVQLGVIVFLMEQKAERWTAAVAATLRAERAVAELSQAQLSERAQIARTSYRLYEEGKRNPTVLQLAQIAEVLGIQFSYLIGEIERRAR